MPPDIEQKVLKELSALEHEQWMKWAGHILETEDISLATRERWQKDMIPYEQLPEEERALDRSFARKSLEVFKKYQDEMANI